MGQSRAVVKNEGRNWEVDRPWDVPLDETSIISIAVDRSRQLVIGNTFDDGGGIQQGAAEMQSTSKYATLHAAPDARCTPAGTWPSGMRFPWANSSN